MIDDLNIVFVALSTFVGFTTSVFSASYVEHEVEIGRLTPTYLRFYHAMYQVLMFAMNLALIANNIGLMWVAIEIATLTTVLMVGIYRTHEALEAAWKYFILGSVGIAFALFGTILVYMAAQPVVGEGIEAMVWSALVEHAAAFDPALLNLAFIFLLLGYGTKVGLAPLHAWLPDAHAEGPTPISAVLSGLLLNVALYAVLRFKILLAGNPEALAPGPLMVILGLVSLIFAALMLYRRRDIKRMFAYSSIEHMGIIVFAFGMGGPLANFAGLLHMTMHSLTKSAIFFSVGHIAQVKGTQRMADIGGLTETHPWLGWGLVLGVVAIAGMPPLGIFMSEFLIVSSTFAREPLLAILLVAGLLIGIGALFLRLNQVAFGEPRGPVAPGEGVLRADVRASGAGVRRGDLSARAARRLVPACRAVAWVGGSERDRPHRLDRRRHPRGGASSLAARAGRRRAVGRRDGGAGRRHADAGRAMGRRRHGADGALGGRGFRRHQPRLPERPISLGRKTAPAGHPARTHDRRPLRPRARGRRRSPPVARSRTLGRHASARRRIARAAQVRRPTPSCRSRAKACIRSRSGRCMRGSSSQGISASPPTARRWCGWRSASATCTRASKG